MDFEGLLDEIDELQKAASFSAGQQQQSQNKTNLTQLFENLEQEILVTAKEIDENPTVDNRKPVAPIKSQSTITTAKLAVSSPDSISALKKGNKSHSPTGRTYPIVSEDAGSRSRTAESTTEKKRNNKPLLSNGKTKVTSATTRVEHQTRKVWDTGATNIDKVAVEPVLQPEKPIMSVNTTEDLGSLRKVTGLRSKFDRSPGHNVSPSTVVHPMTSPIVAIDIGSKNVVECPVENETIPQDTTQNQRIGQKKQAVNLLKERFERAITEAAAPLSSHEVKAKDPAAPPTPVTSKAASERLSDEVGRKNSFIQHSPLSVSQPVVSKTQSEKSIEINYQQPKSPSKSEATHESHFKSKKVGRSRSKKGNRHRSDASPTSPVSPITPLSAEHPKTKEVTREISPGTNPHSAVTEISPSSLPLRSMSFDQSLASYEQESPMSYVQEPSVSCVEESPASYTQESPASYMQEPSPLYVEEPPLYYVQESSASYVQDPSKTHIMESPMSYHHEPPVTYIQELSTSYIPELPETQEQESLPLHIPELSKNYIQEETLPHITESSISFIQESSLESVHESLVSHTRQPLLSQGGELLVTCTRDKPVQHIQEPTEFENLFSLADSIYLDQPWMQSDDGLTIGELLARELPEVPTPPSYDEPYTLAAPDERTSMNQTSSSIYHKPIDNVDPPVGSIIKSTLPDHHLEVEISPSSSSISPSTSTQVEVSPVLIDPISRDRASTLPTTFSEGRMRDNNSTQNRDGLNNHRSQTSSEVSILRKNSRKGSYDRDKSRSPQLLPQNLSNVPGDEGFVPPSALSSSLPFVSTPESDMPRSFPRELSPPLLPEPNFSDVYLQLTEDLQLTLLNLTGSPPTTSTASNKSKSHRNTKPSSVSTAYQSSNSVPSPTSALDNTSGGSLNTHSNPASPSAPKHATLYEFDELTPSDVSEIDDLVEELDKMFVNVDSHRRLNSTEKSLSINNTANPTKSAIIRSLSASPQRSTPTIPILREIGSAGLSLATMPPSRERQRSMESASTIKSASSTISGAGGENSPSRTGERGRSMTQISTDLNSRRASRGSQTSVDSMERLRRNEEKRQDNIITNMGVNRNDPKVQQALSKLAHAQLQKIAVRVYIKDGKIFKTMHLTNLMTAECVVNEVIEKSLLDEQEAWTLFEIFNDLNLERPLKDWEIVTNVIRSWERETNNAIMIRPYGYRSSLVINCLKIFYPQINGWLYHENKKGQFKKRFFELRDDGLYSSKDDKATMTLTCPLETSDVYSLIRPRKKAPSDFCFAVKSQFRMSAFEDADDNFVHFLYADSVERMKDWVLSIRSSKSHLDGKSHPEWFNDDDAVGSASTGSGTESRRPPNEQIPGKPLLSFQKETDSRAIKSNKQNVTLSSSGSVTDSGNSQANSYTTKATTLFDKVSQKQKQVHVSGSISYNGTPIAPLISNSSISKSTSPEKSSQRHPQQSSPLNHQRSQDSHSNSPEVGGKGTLLSKIDRKKEDSLSAQRSGDNSNSYARGGASPKKSLVEMIPKQNNNMRH